MRRLASLALTIALTLACASQRTGPEAEPRPPATDAQLLVSSAAGELVTTPVHAAAASGADYEALAPRAGEAARTVAGWGGAFNEKGWEILQVLSPAARDQVLRRLFEPGQGLSLDMGRIPIGASDYALSRYSLAETPGDLSMEHFSIERDRTMLLPYVKAAQALHPTLRLWGSAWSPPPWMKEPAGFDSGRMRDDPEIYAAYALYLARFVEAYRAEGIPIEAVAVQNEPYILTAYPSCRWEPAQYLTFVRDHLGPTLAARRSGATVMLGTFNQPDNEAHARAVLEDERARSYVGILGLQWDGLPIAGAARRLVPGLRVWHTETDCGNHHWEAGFDPDRPQNDFDYAADTWRHVRDYLDGGAEVYTLWNLVLDETGKSIDASRPWPQNSPVVVDRTTRQVTYTPMFLAFQHWSRFARPGATVLRGSGAREVLALATPDRKILFELLNASSGERRMRLRYGARAWDAVLPPRSFGTLIVRAD